LLPPASWRYSGLRREGASEGVAEVLCECPHCGYELEVLQKLVGRRVKCPRCGERFRPGREPRGTKPRSEGEPLSAASRSPDHFLTRDVGLVIFGLVAVLTILGALGWRMYMDHQRRVAQSAIKAEAWAAKEAGDLFRQRQEYVQARESYLEAQARLAELEVRDRRLERRLKTILETEEINYLGREMVKFRGQWMTRAEKAAIVGREQGLVEFEGLWVTPEEKARLEAEKQRAEVAARLTQEEGGLRGEAEERGREVVEMFLRSARDDAPSDAAERYMSSLAGGPLEYPRIVFNYRIDDTVTYVLQDPERKHPEVSAIYCGVKAYVTTASPIGQERVVWTFQVRKVGNEWKITYAKPKEAPQLTPEDPATAP